MRTTNNFDDAYFESPGLCDPNGLPTLVSLVNTDTVALNA